jgi:hypothetical protein
MKHAMDRLFPKLFPGLAALAFAFGGLFTRPAEAAEPRYHFVLVSVVAKDKIKPEVARTATPRVEAKLKKVFAEHPQLVAKLDGAPDPKASEEAYRAFLAKAGIKGAYRVQVEITEATEEQGTGPNGAPQLAVHLALRMFGERIPDSTLGFSGQGKGTVKEEVSAKVREREREEAWNDIAEVVIADAMKTALAELAQGKPKAKGAKRH